MMVPMHAIERHRKPRGLGHERRGEILAAAKEMFVAEGYETVTTRRLADRVGISQTGLYVYFKSKEEILDALCRITFVRLAERLREVEAEAAPGEAVLKRLIEAYVQFGVENPDEYRITFMVGHGAKPGHKKDLSLPPEDLGPGMQAFFSFRDQIARIREAEGSSADDLDVAAEVIWASMHGLVAALIAGVAFPWFGTREQLTDTLGTALIRGLR